jgi:glutaredoxin
MFNLTSVQIPRLSLFGICVSIAIASIPTKVSAQSIDCPNYWINPKTGQTECFVIYKGSLIRNSQQFLNASNIVLVYGRESCGWTQQMLEELNQLGIPYQYRDVDNEAMSDEMWTALRFAGQDTSSSVGLPVISINKQVMIRPDVTEVMSARK